MTPDLDPNSDAKILQIFLQPIFANLEYKTSRDPTPKCYTFLETSHDPQIESQLRCKRNLHIFCNQLFLEPSSKHFQRHYTKCYAF